MVTPPVYDDPSGQDWVGPRRRVSEMQANLHRWAAADPGRRFDDLFNLVHDPATLIVAWDRVATNHGAKTAGSDGWTVTRGWSTYYRHVRTFQQGVQFPGYALMWKLTYKLGQKHTHPQ